MHQTDKDWEELSRQNAYFAVLTDPNYANPELDETVKQQFFASGQDHIRDVVRILREKFGFDGRNIRSALDFGSGVGRLLFPMAKIARLAIGVDIADTMRSICQANAKDNGVNNILLSPNVDYLLTIEDIDWINSYIVFQHIAPERGCAIFDKLVYALKPGGFISVHFTIFKDERASNYMNNRVKFFRNGVDGVTSVLLHPEDAGHLTMQMYDYDLSQIMAILVKHGVHQVWLEHEDQDGFHGIRLYARK